MDYYYPKERDPSVNEYFDPEVMKAFAEWNGKVFSPGRLDKKTKELVAVATRRPRWRRGRRRRRSPRSSRSPPHSTRAPPLPTGTSP
jgi:hypothetical protein